MCLGTWSKLGYVLDEDVLVVAARPDLDGDEEELASDWDFIG